MAYDNPPIVKNYHLTEKDISSLFNLIQAEAVVLSTTPKIDIIKDGPDDNKILSCAIESKADYIVSGLSRNALKMSSSRMRGSITF